MFTPARPSHAPDPGLARPGPRSASKKVDDISHHQSKHNPDPKQNPKNLPAQRPNDGPEPIPPAGTHPKVAPKGARNIVL